MNRKQYEIDNLPTQIVIGHQTETGVTSIYFDCTSWLASWPDLVLGVWATQPGGTAAYPAATHMEGDVLVWDVTDSDTAVPGVGTVEIVGITTGKKKLSAIAKTQIMCTTTGTTTTPPEGAKAWVDSVMQAANDAETSKSQAATYAQNAAASAEKAEENAKSVTWETLSGKPSTFPPDSHTHTLESLGAASAESVNQLKADMVKYRTAVNLLDNSDFTNPVNQRNAGTVFNDYVIDRWYGFKTTDGSVSIITGGITATGDGYLQQRLPSGTLKSGVVYTIAVYYLDGTIDVNTNGEYAILDQFDVVNNIKPNGKTIAHVALYEGTYTADTLPPYVPKGYAAELAACNSAPVDVGGGYGGGSLQAYPVGAVYISVNSTSPASLFGGTWEQIKGRFLLATGEADQNSDTYFGQIAGGWNAVVGSTGGQDYHTLTPYEMPSHSHNSISANGDKTYKILYGTGGDITTSAGTINYTSGSGVFELMTATAGGGQPHNNMPPYMGVYMWKRVS